MARITIEEALALERKGIKLEWQKKDVSNKGADLKYNSNSIEENGIKFRSELERKRFGFLTMLKNTGKIKDFSFEPKKFILQEKYIYNNKTYPKITYTPDFKIELNNGKIYWEDTKSEATRKKESYRIKMKIFVLKYIVTDTNIIDFKEIFKYDEYYF